MSATIHEGDALAILRTLPSDHYHGSLTARYLARLILPPIPDARMLTPFSGSGSEVIGALQAGWSHVDGIDSWDVAVRISRARIAHWSAK